MGVAAFCVKMSIIETVCNSDFVKYRTMAR
jgi:hypothetical protein